MEHKFSTARSDLEQILVDETAHPKALPLYLLEDITGNFSEDREIGRGGFSVVYKGILGDRSVALKKLTIPHEKEKEFDREIRCLMRVKHKNVVRFLGYCDDRQRNIELWDGKLIMADVHVRVLCFEYVPNRSLVEYISDEYHEWGTCYKIIKGICEGLQYLHDNHIIHLDLKPANILLDNNMVPKITDFGISRCFEGNQTRDITETISGTLGYLAPERLDRGEIAPRADLYSLGVIMVEVLTGRKDSQDSMDVLMKSWSDRLERSQDTQLKEIQVCYEIALECKESDPKKRPASAQDIIDRLREMESIQMHASAPGGGQAAEAASSTSGVALAPIDSKGKCKDEPHPHPLYHGPRDDRQEGFAGASSYHVASTSRAPAAESKGKSKDKPRVLDSSEPRHATLHAMPVPPEQTVVMPRPHRLAQVAATPGWQYGLTETKPPLPARLGWPATMAATKIAYKYDMVEPMSYLYVSVVKARDLPTMDITGALDLNPYVEVKLGNFKGVTRHLEKTYNPVWRETFAFSGSGAHLHGSQLEVIVMDKDTLRDDFVGRVALDMSDIPKRLPPDSPLAPQWYTLSDPHGEPFWDHRGLGEIMLAVWLGTQADEAFPEAWPLEAHSLSREGLTNTRSKVYYSPKLCCLKIAVIAAQDLITSYRPTIVKIQMGRQVRRTRSWQPHGSGNQVWNEEFMFVACEPFQDPLVVTVEEKVAAGRGESIGRIIIPVASRYPYVPRNDLAKSVPSKWFNLNLSRGMTVNEAATTAIIPVVSPHFRRTYQSRWVRWVAKSFRLSRSRVMSVVDETPADMAAGDVAVSVKSPGKIHLKMSLEMAYNMSEDSSDLQPAAGKLRKNAIGLLEVGILRARGLGDNKNPYCVGKYGAKWVRTRTLLGTAAPAWNEQYTWEVFDLSTVITVAVFDNNHLHYGDGKDQRIGKLRVRLTTLESDRVHTQYYPLMALTPGGLKKSGELHLAVRFTCTAWANMLAQYGRPLLPKMHYTNPISMLQLDYLRFQAMQMVATRLERAEPPLHKEVVEYMLDVDSHMFSLRRSKANFHRITYLFSGVVAVGKWLDDVCKWKNPLTTVLLHVVFLKLVWCPKLILPTVLLGLIMTMAWNYGVRPRELPHMDTVLPHTELAHSGELDDTFSNIDAVLWWCRDQMYPDELDEEFDTFPTSKPDDIVRLRYERLRGIAGTVQAMGGFLATHAERLHLLLVLLDPTAATQGEHWHDDPRLMAVFLTLSLVVAILLYLTPFRMVAMMLVLYFLRPPWFRGSTNLLLNLYSRLPSKDDLML